MGLSEIWQRLYAGGHRVRWRFYEGRGRRLPRPVVSIGNIHWGGTGKTPVVAAVAARLRDERRRVAILSRGYGRRGRGATIVSRGGGLAVPVDRAGDEPALLAEKLPGVPVAVAKRRFEAGELLLDTCDEPPEVFLLDDGFSHLDLHRDVDVVVLPVDDPLGGGRLPPSGRLREPLEALGRADAILVTGDEVDEREADAVAAAVAHTGFGGPVFPCPRAVALAVEETRSEPFLLVTGIARPERVAASAARLGLDVLRHLDFPDHHSYPERSRRRIAAAFESVGARAVLTTAKDAVKLRDRLELPIAVLVVDARPADAFWRWLDERLLEGS